MKWEHFEPLFEEEWGKRLKPFIESEECDKIYAFLKETSMRGKILTPSSSQTFRCFKETPFNDLKLVLCGFSPYHTAKNGKLIADGLLFGCSNTNQLQPSLEQFYNAIERELYHGVDISYEKNPDVSYLAKQGVLMLNASLTTELLKPGKHLSLWEPFIKYLFEEILMGTGVPIVLLGKESLKVKKYVPPFTHLIEVSHPASASYSNSEWDSEGLFLKIGKILKDTNNYSINWLNIKSLI